MSEQVSTAGGGSVTKKPKILTKKYYLYLTEFFAGMSVMAVELGASRLLAPYFSSSQIVWTIIIGTIMIAMALGNIWGGKSADKNPNPDKLYTRLLIAAVWIAAIPLLGKYIIVGVAVLLAVTISTNFLVIAAFLACMLIFVFPLFLLGTVTPSLVKFTMESMEESGKTVGVLGAYNTVGSIIGTFLPTFVTIPAVGTAVTFFIFAGILLLLALVYFISEKTAPKRMIAAVLIFAFCAVFGSRSGFAFWDSSLVYEGESIYNYLQVSETDRRVILSTNVLFGVQSVAMKDGSLTGMYYDYAMAAPLMAGLDEESDGDILILGMGTGTYARQCLRYFPDLHFEGVEIDKKITDLSKEYFFLPDGVQTVTYDGRAYIAATDKKYDVIMVDAYQDITIPFQMSTVEFFSLVKAHLKEDGVMVVNMNMYADGEGSNNAYLQDTIAGVFDHVLTADVAYSSNRELFASDSTEMATRFDTGRETLENTQLQRMMARVFSGLSDYEGGTLRLTDDKAPVELLGMAVIDDMIRDSLAYYKEILKERGIRGLIDNFL